MSVKNNNNNVTMNDLNNMIHLVNSAMSSMDMINHKISTSNQNLPKEHKTIYHQNLLVLESFLELSQDIIMQLQPKQSQNIVYLSYISDMNTIIRRLIEKYLFSRELFSKEQDILRKCHIIQLELSTKMVKVMQSIKDRTQNILKKHNLTSFDEIEKKYGSLEEIQKLIEDFTHDSKSNFFFSKNDETDEILINIKIDVKPESE